MKTKFNQKIENIELMKIEKPVNRNQLMKYFYNIKIEGIDDFLIIETHLQINSDELKGSSIKYELDNATNEVSKFEFFA
jgi:hypothetical protein